MSEPETIYQFTAKDSDGADVVIIVNTASHCGFTNSNYSQLKELLDKYKEKGLEVAAFPCNQFGRQEPGCSVDIKSFVKEKFQFDPDLYDKIDVNGANTHPLFEFLKKEQPGFLFAAIKWNFTKFLVNRKGQVVARYAPSTKPKDMIPDIEKLLAEEP